VWTKASNLATLVNWNQPLPNAAGNNALGPLPYPLFGTFIEYRQQNGHSNYKGIDFGLEKRFSAGFGFGIAYTLADSKDNTSEHLATQGSNSFPQEARNLDAWYGPSDFDIRHRLAVNYVFELPFGSNKKYATSGVGSAILGGWTWSGIYALRSGRPFTVSQSSNNVGTSMFGMPNVTGSTPFPKTVDQWMTLEGFQAVTSGTFGNEQRNQYRGPRWQSFDMSLARTFRINTRFGATLRWDVFNLFNSTNLGLPNRNISSPATFGTITSLAGDARIMQLSARFAF